MFCKYCGKPIDETTMRCRICGRPVGALEGGNGFWDLTGEKPADTPSVDEAALRQLREQVQSLRTELTALRAQPAAKKHGAGVLAALLALLALAVGVFALFQLRGLAGSLEELKTGRSVQVNLPAASRAEEIQPEQGTGLLPGFGEQSAVEDQSGVAEQLGLRTPWERDEAEKIELDDGVTYVLWPGYFDGPRGEGGTKRQSITSRDPLIRQTDKQLIFVATFKGQYEGDAEQGIGADPGNYDVYWAKVELDEEGKPALVERLELDEERFVDEIDANKTHRLSIIGGAEDGEEGCYALIAEKTNSLTGRYAYVSEIIELYIRES